ncbi:XdhC family protein [Kribbella ginsengisoli]
MREVLGELYGWWERGESAVLASVVATSSSTPRSSGAAMLVGPGGEAIGSISGGCVEGAVYDAALEVMTSGEPRLEQYGFNNENFFAVGLACGGSVEVFIRLVNRASFPDLASMAADIDAGRPVCVATVMSGDLAGRHSVIRPTGACRSIGGGLDDTLTAEALRMLAAGRPGTLTPDGRPDVTVFFESFPPPPRMLIFGAVDFAAALAQTGKFLGYRVTICDARAIFATPARFPVADEVVVDWPHRYLAMEASHLDARSVVCVLTHDEKFDIPLLNVALRLPQLAYIGAMGSRRTAADRLTQLSKEGLTPTEIDRLSTPIGLDLGSSSPEETAISIAAEIIAIRSGRSAGRLTGGTGPIHRERPAP